MRLLVRCMSEGLAAWIGRLPAAGKRQRSPEPEQYKGREEALVDCLRFVHDHIPNTSVMCRHSNLMLLICALQYPEIPWNRALKHMRGQPLDPELTPSLVFGEASVDDDGWVSVLHIMELVLAEQVRRAMGRETAVLDAQ